VSTNLVLVVEDDADLRELLSMMIESMGVEVVSASNGKEALERMATKRPRMILLDMRMPVMDGWQFVREVDRRGGPRPPIVVVTAAPNPAERASEVRAEAWLSKPFDRETLVRLVDRFVRSPQANASACSSRRSHDGC
jgi:CheY-like chemotaxis protein